MAHQHLWGYDAHNGPHTWAKSCDNAAGLNQSPINIETARAVYDKTLTDHRLTLHVGENKGLHLTNVGHGFQVKLEGTAAELSNGPLHSKYKLLQFHMHWGREDGWGSEHTINGQPGAAELHLVFWNAEKYSKIEDALHSHDGLAVLGAIVKDGEDHAELAELFNNFSSIRLPSQSVENLPPIDLKKILPGNLDDYYTYSGSLTTPPCNECVTWIVFKDPIFMSKKQLVECRQLRCSMPGEDDKGCLEETYRTTCPVGNRVVRKSFA